MSYREGDPRGYVAWVPPAQAYQEYAKRKRERGFREMWGDYYPVITGQVRQRIRVKAATKEPT
jgi:hypothetical protein